MSGCGAMRGSGRPTVTVRKAWPSRQGPRAGRLRLHAAALGIAVVLAGCVSVPSGPAPVSSVLDAPAQQAAQQRLEAREATVAALPVLAFSGRVALSKGRDGGNGRLDWRQEGGAYRVTLSAPVTRQSWSLQGGPDGARIEGLDGGPREGADVGLLLREATGLEIPVAALAAWAAGARADATRFGPAVVEFDAEGQLVRLRQDGWTVDYLGWQPPEGPPPVLPLRVNAQRDDARVRLIVDAWTLDDGAVDAGVP